MATLNWIGKEAVVNHHKKVPVRLLECDRELSAGDPDSGNLLVEGDNLEALKALLPRYKGQVKCIYIDPPYNTGNEGWVYNDNVNDPRIKKWLGEVVGKEAEDLCRHDKWLCMMYPRLAALREFMRPDGVIFISIGKDEIGHLRVLCDEIFGPQHLLEVFIWQIEGNVENQEAITSTHEYVLAYERNAGASQPRVTLDPNVDDDSKLLRDFAENSVIKNGPGNPASMITLPVGFPAAIPSLRLEAHSFAEEFKIAVESDEGYIKRELRQRFDVDYPIRFDDLVVEEGGLAQPCRVYSGWSSARKIRRFIEIGCTPLTDDDGSTLKYFVSHTGVPTYRRESRQAHFVPSILRNMGTTERSSNELERMGVRFPYPKPVPLVQYLASLYAGPDDLILDSFAGSGTTGHAVLALNQEDRGNRRFILIQMEESGRRVAKDVTAFRLTKACNGYTARRGARTIEVEGLGSGFKYCRLGRAIFNEHGNISSEIPFVDLARYVFLLETGVPTPTRPRRDNPLIGVHEGRAVYLLYNGVLGDRRPVGGNILTRAVLDGLPAHPAGSGERVVYGEGHKLSEATMKKLGITFRQTPYSLHREG